MQNFMKTVINAVQSWTDNKIKKSKKQLDDRISNSIADWNQNDSSADNYVKNRTHWEEVKQKYLIPETSVFISEVYGYESLSDSLPLLTIGQEYIVVLNGTTYKCIAREYDGSSAIIGNGTIYGDDNEGNGEPFSCDSHDDGSIYLNVATAGKYTISISIAQTEIHKLNSKYLNLPTNLATTDDVQGALNVADAAQNTANNAQNTANNAQNTANNAQRLAETNEVNLLTSIATSADMPKKSYSNCELIYGDGKILAITGRGFLCNSNGIDWTFASYNSTKSWSAGAYGDGKFVIIRDGQSGNINLNKFAYSTDGITWNATNVIPYIPGTTSTSLWSNIAYGAGKFVAISSGVGPHLAYSYDGITWTCDYNNATIYPLSYVKDLIYAGDKFVATGNNYIGYSLDGNTWKAVRTNSDFISITYGGGKFVVLGSRSKTNMAIYSADGVTWETAYLPIEADWHDVAYGNGKFVAVAQNDGIAAYSIDGIIWEKINVPNKQWRSVIYGNDRFIACSNTGEVMYSYDGIVWKTEYVKLYQNNEDVTDKIGETILDPKKLATEEYVSTKMNADNPVGTGSFSLNRKSGTTVGNYSHAEGLNATASGNHSHAEGYNTTASGNNQHVHGRYNIADLAEGDAKYVHIVGNGTSDTARSNAHTLDWNGVGWFQGGLQVGGTEQDGEGVGYVPAVSGPVQPGQLLSVKAIDENGKPTEWEAADAVKTVNGIAPDENGNVEVSGGLNETARALLIVILRNAVYTSDQSANIAALENALASNTSGGEVPDIPDEPNNPEVTLVSIAATYSGGDVAVGTAVTALTGIVVTAMYSDGTSETVTGYTLSGEIAEGSNTITVSYGGKTTTFNVVGVAESGGDETDIHDGYVSDGLEFRLDGIRNTESGHVANTNWSDVSGNNHAITINSAYTTFNNDHIYSENRNTVKVTDHVALLSKLSNYTFEVVWKSPKAVQDRNNNPLVAVGDGAANYPLLNCGKMITVGSKTTYGTYVSGETQINHYTITYDGTAQKLYHEGVLDAEIAANIDITAATKVNFFGNDAWSNHTNGYYYAVRVYTRALSAEEVKANYNNDIARFGTGVA